MVEGIVSHQVFLVAVGVLMSCCLIPVTRCVYQNPPGSPYDSSGESAHGRDAVVGQFPSSVALAYQGEYPHVFCSGILIADNLVLTGASCVCNGVQQTIVTAGEVNPEFYLNGGYGIVKNASIRSATMQVRRIERVLVEPRNLKRCEQWWQVHPRGEAEPDERNKKTYWGLNVALLRLNESFHLDGSAVDVAPFDFGNDGSGQSVIATGYGVDGYSHTWLRFGNATTQQSCADHADNWLYARNEFMENLLCVHVTDMRLETEDIGGGLYAADGRTLVGVNAAFQKGFNDWKKKFDAFLGWMPKENYPVKENYFVSLAKVRRFIEDSLAELRSS